MILMAAKEMDKTRENYLRRQAKRLDLFLMKSKAKKWSFHNRCGYRICDLYSDACLWGSDFELDIDDVQKLLDEYEANSKEAEGANNEI